MSTGVARPCIAQIQPCRLLLEGGPAGVETVLIWRICTTNKTTQFDGCFVCQTQEGWLPGLGSLQDVIGQVRSDGSEGDGIDVLAVLVVWRDRAAIEDALAQDAADGVDDFGGVQVLVTTKADQQGLESIPPGRREEEMRRMGSKQPFLDWQRIGRHR